MANLSARLVRTVSKLGVWKRGFADDAAGAFSLIFATPTKVCLIIPWVLPYGKVSMFEGLFFGSL